MCGIIGYVGSREAGPLLLEGLQRLEYRGYDSAGFAVLDGDGDLHLKKHVGKLSNLVAALEGVFPPGTTGLAHTRWATHGRPSDDNAHPHQDCGGDVAVVHNADQKSVDEIGSEVVRLADAARNRRLSPEDASGQTFTVSNIGAVGGGFGTPIIPLGTSAILSVGRADPKPVVDDGEIVAARVFPLSLSYDHRLIDGAEGRSFMADLIETLERP